MARPSSASTRTLTLTEELEKLEQSITLTLQEIDHNFSRAHRIVTTSILPIVEQYAKHSEAVWEGSKFWKHFFEASANVSLEGYDDAQVEDSNGPPEETDHDVPDSSHAYTVDGMNEGDDTITAAPDHAVYGSDNEDILSSPSMAHAHSTPRMPSTEKGKKRYKAGAPPPRPTFEEYPSPYEALKREMEGKGSMAATTFDGATQPTTPGKAHALPDMSMTPGSSPFVLGKNGAPDTAQRNKDTILHQGILNKTYRVAATPHGKPNRAASTMAVSRTPGTANRTRSRWFDETMSSPDEPTPQLRAEIFSSPVRLPRTPGASVLTPGFKKKFAQAARDREDRTAEDEAQEPDRAREKYKDEPTSNFTRSWRAQWESDDENEDLLGMSPPKTIHFDIPKRPLLQTPAREASRRIMEDLLLTAGGDITEEIEEDYSPSIVKRKIDLDETF